VRRLFSLPVSNGNLERTFSQVNLIKCSKRTSLVLNADKVPLQEFSPEDATDLWWKAKNKSLLMVRRSSTKSVLHVVKHWRFQTRSGTDSSEEEDEEDKLLLDDWDDWMQEDSD